MARVANYQQQRNDKNNKRNTIETFPPLAIVRDVLAAFPDDWRFPSLKGVLESPALRPDGTIIAMPGYDQATCLFYKPPKNLQIKVPDKPTHANVSASVAALGDILSDFPFDDRESSKANAIAGMLTTICRPAIAGPTPLLLIDATEAGSGKSLLAEVISIIATGQPKLNSAAKDPAEWNKKITSLLRAGNTVVIMDNVNESLDSGDLCRALTAEFWSDRLMSTHQEITLPVRCSWIATGNNIQLDGDMPRRCYRVRLNPRCSKPSERTGWKHNRLKDWVREHRGNLLSALLTLARAWFLAGKPEAQVRTMGSFEDWAETIGGILQYSGISGFLENRDEMFSQADAEAMQWEGFLLTLNQIFYSEPFLAADVTKKLAEKTFDESQHRAEPSKLATQLSDSFPTGISEASNKPNSFSRHLGSAFTERVERRFGRSGVYLKRAGISHHAQQWKIELPAA